MLETRRVDVDRTMAELYLSFEKRPEYGVKGTNRRHSDRVVREYTDAMLAGEWRLTHQGIAFKDYFHNNTAVLADGGHRMRAVIKADAEQPGIVIPFMVTEGLTEEDVLALDIGRKRNPGTFLEMDGEVDTNVLGAVAKLTWLYMNELLDNYAPHQRSPLSPKRLKQHIQDNPDLRQAVVEGRRLKHIVAPTAAGSFWFLARENDQDPYKVAQFLDGLASGADLPVGDPRLTFRNLMINSVRERRSRETYENLALMIKAYNRYAKGEESLKLAWRVDEDFPTF